MDPELLLELEPVGPGAFDRISDSLRADRSAALTALEEAALHHDALVTIAINIVGVTARGIDIEDNRLPDSGRVEGVSIRTVIEQVDDLIAKIDRERSDDTLIVVSHSGPVPPPLPSNPVAAIREALASEVAPGREDGFVLISGEVRASREGSPIVSVVDIVPTALFAAGMPVARDLDGRIITEAFDGTPLAARGVSYILSYEQVAPPRD